MHDPLLDSEHVQFLDSVRSFVDAEIVPHATAWDLEERYPQDLLAEFGRLGWLGV
jgi:alkylation response protein AidB-like acyl-CoA dehydrogenase